MTLTRYQRRLEGQQRSAAAHPTVALEPPVLGVVGDTRVWFRRASANNP